jgi:phosphate:Na+ symporter
MSRAEPDPARHAVCADGATELQSFHRRELENCKLALSVSISSDIKIARQLIEDKVAIREAERLAAEHHLARLREGRT